ncbi:cell wall-active antibiotics response protein [Cellulomonas hominis]|uniref:LiaF transmembrane domain-containing protein n=2 Tax=Cellulomonas hominis TaxID=156981 RepID=A0A7W8SEI1_9CELL|nr:DUF5668 domain-containing protein [Cellulomonas hominis]MBB5473339.1 hypothetical protein [Cellulomonas hominis]MBU5421271.1 cell wall-active antibiotics response protein [Cellulomonas hominis]NKY07532.1 cell wall-active antibiotics response protein [Cellulomonas hominis]
MAQRPVGQLLLGTVLVLAGGVLLLDRLDVLQVASLWEVLLPLAVIAVGAAALALVPRAWIGPVLILGLGTFWLLEALDLVHGSASTYALPIALALLGCSILVAATGRRTDPDRLRMLVFFWGGDRRTTSQQFRSASITAVFGGIDLDLRAANIVDRARIDVFTMFGGVEMKVPPTWRVRLNNLSVFGGSDDKTVPPPYPDAPVLDVHVVAIFGGATVKHGKPLAQEQPAAGY